MLWANGAALAERSRRPRCALCASGWCVLVLGRSWVAVQAEAGRARVGETSSAAGGFELAGVAADSFEGAADIGGGHDPGQVAVGEDQRPALGARVQAGQHVGYRLIRGGLGDV